MHLPEPLCVAARNGEINILVGAGTSVDAGLPDWPTLLHGMADQLPAPEQAGILTLLETGRYLDAAQLIRDSPGYDHQLLRSRLTTSQPSSPILKAIWDVWPVVVFTTNFDNLLESSFARHFGRTPNIVVGVAANSALITPRDTIVKLHGDLAHPASIVLSRADYYRLMVTALTQPSNVWAEFVRRPCFAIGYSLRDPDLQLLLHWFDSTLRGVGNTLYLLSPRMAAEELRLLRLIPHVQPIEYAGAHRAAIDQALQILRSERERGSPVDRVAAARLSLLLRTQAEAMDYLHDLNNGLTAALSDVQLWQREARGVNSPGDPAKWPERLERLGGELRRIAGNSWGCQGVLRSDGERLSPASWADCRKRLRTHLSDRAYDAVKVRMASGSAAMLPLGPSLFSRMVRILLDNALEAVGKAPSEVGLSIAVRKGRSRIFLNVTVTDDGPGIPEDILPRLGSSGVSSKGDGRGHGLFLVEVFATEAGGSLAFRSRPGQGTVAVLTIPLHDPTAPSASGHASRRGAPSAAKLEILLVEDEPTVRELVDALLHQAGWRVNAFESPLRALASLSRRHRPPDCAIVDVVMPQMSGYDFASELRERFPQVPVLFVSGYVSAGAAKPVSAAGFIEKPFNARTLTDAVEALVSEYPVASIGRLARDRRSR